MIRYPQVSLRPCRRSGLGRSVRVLAPMLVLLMVCGTARADAGFDGLWRSTFAGVALEIEGEAGRLYQVSESFRWSLDAIQIDGAGAFATADGRRYQLIRTETGLDILDAREQVFLRFVPVEDLPPGLAPTSDPGATFDVFWESFAENHALFDLAGVDWQQQRDAARAEAAGAESPAALFDLLSGMLEPLEDRHTTLVWPQAGRIFRAGRESDPFWRGRANTFLALISEHYLDGPLQSRFADPRLRFGRLPGEVGYLHVSDFLDGVGLPPFDQTLDAVLDALGDTRALVVDLRFNPGGVDLNTLAFMERLWPPGEQAIFARERRLSGPLPARFDRATVQWITGRENPFHRRPLVFLTAADTASAAETLLLAALNRPRVVQVGETSAGVFSNLLLRYLPNGWYSTLSNERFYSLNGISYEQRGIAPHREISQSNYDLEAGVDAALDAALAAIESQPAPVDTVRELGQSVTGLWFDPDRDGEGWHLQAIDAQRVFVTFYSFSPTRNGAPDWLVGLAHRSPEGDLILDEAFTASGGRFGATADDPPIVLVPWGTGRLQFSDCRTGVAELSGPDAYRGFTYRLRRLSGVPGLDCTDGNSETDTSTNSESGPVANPDLAGSWFVPERPGEGWLLSPISSRDFVVSWYTFDESGTRRWFIGVGSVSEAGELTVPSLTSARGATWGHDFDAATVTRHSSGRLVIQSGACGEATIRFEPIGGGPTQSFSVRRLTAVSGLRSGAGCS